MKRTYVTVMPNQIGAFLKASRCFSDLGINITRASYNKAVDSHCLFIDAEGPEELLDEAQKRLESIGYIQDINGEKSVILIEFKLKDEPGCVTPLLEVIEAFHLNISYISSEENGEEYQFFKMGLITEQMGTIHHFLEEAKKLCEVRIIEYNHADRNFDNSIFYNNFVLELSDLMDLSKESEETLLINVNLAMQELDESGVSPYKTFDSISRIAGLLSAARKDNFHPRITRTSLTEKTELLLIEPPCGSNTAILKQGEDYLFVDTGYACYEEEMYTIFRTLIPNFDNIKKKAYITHADVDHCGLTPKFDLVFATRHSAESLRLEYEGDNAFREQNRIHKPYITICKELTMYRPTPTGKVRIIGGVPEDDKPLSYIGEFSFGELVFEIYEGKGGHLKGESVLIDRSHHLVFSGDILVNIKGMTKEQAQYNRYAPILMTSVDTDPKLCAEERVALYETLGKGVWHIYGGHGAEMVKEI